MLMAEETVDVFHMTGKSHGCVDKLGYLKALMSEDIALKLVSVIFRDHSLELNK